MTLITWIRYFLVNIAIPNIEPLSPDTFIIVPTIWMKGKSSQGNRSFALNHPEMTQQCRTVTPSLTIRLNCKIIDERSLEKVNHICVADESAIILHSNEVHRSTLMESSQKMKVLSAFRFGKHLLIQLINFRVE